MKVVFETERLIIREWEPEQDAADVFEMYTDPEVMFFLGGEAKMPASLDDQKGRLERSRAIYAERNDGTGGWAMVTKEDGRIVGTMLLKALPDNDGVPTERIEVGWHLKRKEWGKGFATEGATGALGYGFDLLGLERIYAVVMKDNLASIAVTKRLGMKPLGTTNDHYGLTLELFDILAS